MPLHCGRGSYFTVVEGHQGTVTVHGKQRGKWTWDGRGPGEEYFCNDLLQFTEYFILMLMKGHEEQPPPPSPEDTPTGCSLDWLYQAVSLPQGVQPWSQGRQGNRDSFLAGHLNNSCGCSGAAVVLVLHRHYISVIRLPTDITSQRGRKEILPGRKFYRREILPRN